MFLFIPGNFFCSEVCFVCKAIPGVLWLVFAWHIFYHVFLLIYLYIIKLDISCRYQILRSSYIFKIHSYYLCLLSNVLRSLIILQLLVCLYVGLWFVSWVLYSLLKNSCFSLFSFLGDYLNFCSYSVLIYPLWFWPYFFKQFS